MSKMTTEEAEICKEMFLAGQSITEIAKSRHHDRKAVIRNIRNLGIEVQQRLAPTKEEFDICENMYLSGTSIEDICKIRHHGRKTITNEFKKRGITIIHSPEHPNFVTQKEIDKIIELYNAGKNVVDIAKQLKRERHVVVKYLKQNGIQNRSSLFTSKYAINENFFDVIDSEAKAYYLGFLYADGHISKHGQKTIVVAVNSKDEILLKHFLESMECSYPIYHIPPSTVVDKDGNTYHKGPQSRISITNRHMHDRLVELGMIDKLHVPKDIEKLFGHFIRGVFDGDGCFCPDKRCVATGRLSILAEKCFCEELDLLLRSMEIDNNYVRRVKGIYSFEKYEKHSLNKLYQIIYQNAHYYLKRKFDKWEEWRKANEFCTSTCSFSLFVS